MSTPLFPRQAMLDTLTQMESSLRKNLAEYKPKDPTYQEDILAQYILFQADLSRLKTMISMPSPSDPPLSDTDIQEALKTLTSKFEAFSLRNGFTR